MNNNGILSLGFEQGESIFDSTGFSTISGTVETESDLMDKLDDHFLFLRRVDLKRFFYNLLPDLFTILAHELAIADVPGIYTQMRRNLLSSEQHLEDKQLLTFLNELQFDIDAEFQRYRKGDIVLNPHGPYAFMVQIRTDIDNIESSRMPVKFTPEQREAARKEVLAHPDANSEVPVLCYNFGNFRRHFVDYIKKIYRRSVYMTSIIEFCSSCLWINQSIETFRMGGQILNFEAGAEGVILRYIASEDLKFRLRGEYTGPDLGSGKQNKDRVISYEDSEFSFPMIPEFVPHLRVHHDVKPDANGLYGLTPTVSETDEVLEVSNRTSKPLDIKIGREVMKTVPAYVSDSDAHIFKVPARLFIRKVEFRFLDI